MNTRMSREDRGRGHGEEISRIGRASARVRRPRSRPLQPGVGPILLKHPARGRGGTGPDPPGVHEIYRRPARRRARAVVVTMHRAKDPEFRSGGLLPDVSEAAPARPGALSHGC